MKYFSLFLYTSIVLLCVLRSPIKSVDAASCQSKQAEPKIIVLSKQTIPTNFNKWEFVEFMAGKGGGTGVHVYCEKESNTKFTIKEALHPNHLLEEALSKGLYRALGFNAPYFMVIDRTTHIWPQPWKDKFPSATRLLISQFIEGNEEHTRSNEEKRVKICRWIDVLLGNFDLAGHNYIIGRDGQIWPIDFGCSLRFGASGQVKGFENLWGYFWPKEVSVIAPTAEELIDFTLRLPTFFETLMDFHRQWSIAEFPTLWNIMTSRIHSFLHTYDPNAPQFWGDRPAIEGKVAGGILLVCNIGGVPHGLVARRADSWADVGGGATANDQTTSRTSWREAIEELGGFLSIDYDTLAVSPKIEHFGDILYCMYLLRVPHIDINQLKAHVASQNNPYKREHDDYKWLPLELLPSTQDLYGPMRALLSTDHARSILRNFGKGHNLKAVKCGGVFNGTLCLGDYSFRILKADLLPTKIWNGKVAIARDLRRKLRVTPDIMSINPLYSYTASQGMVRAFLHKFRDYRDSDDKPITNFEELLLAKSSYFKANPTRLPGCLPLIQQIINTETGYPNHYVYLHGTAGHFGLVWTIGSILRDALFLEPENSVRTLRLYENVFDGISSFADHIQAIPKGMSRDDYSLGWQPRVLSTNLSFLGSLGRESSETMDYFFSNKYTRSGDDPRGLLTKFLQIVLKLPKMAVDQFMASIEPHFITLNEVGALWQCFLPSNLSAQYTGLSHPGGKRAIFVGQDASETTINSTVPFLDILRRTPIKILDAVQEDASQGFDFSNVQGRVLLHPDYLYGSEAFNIHTRVYFSNNTSALALYNEVKEMFMRLIYPHLHLASTAQAYVTPPRLLQLNYLLTGRAADRTDPRLKELMELAAKAEPSKDPFVVQSVIHYEGIGEALNDIILAKLNDKDTASLEKVDPLTLQRIRAIDQSPMLQPMSRELATQLSRFTQEQWTALLMTLTDRFKRIRAFLVAQGLHHPDHSILDLAHLLGVDQADPNFERLKHVVQCDHVQNVLGSSDGERMKRHIGRVLATFTNWGKLRRPIIRALIGYGFIVLDGKTDNSSVIHIDKKHTPERIRDAVKMLGTFMLRRESMFMSFDDIINEVLEHGIEESRSHLAQAFKDLEIQQPLNILNLQSLLQRKRDIGDQWSTVAKRFVHLLKTYTNTDYDIVDGLTLCFTVDTKKIEQMLSLMETEGLLRSGVNDSVCQFLNALCLLQNPQEVISQVKMCRLTKLHLATLSTMIYPEVLDILTQLTHLQIPLDQFSDLDLTQTVDTLKKMTPTLRKECLRLMGKVAQLKGSDLQPYQVIYIMDAVFKNPTRVADIESLIPSYFATTFYGDLSREIGLALNVESSSFSKLKLFYQLGFKLQECEDQKRPYKDVLSLIDRNFSLFTSNVEFIHNIVRTTLTPVYDGYNPDPIYEDWFDMVFTHVDGQELSKEALNSLAGLCACGRFRVAPEFPRLVPHIVQLGIPFQEVDDALCSRQLYNMLRQPEFYRLLNCFSRNINNYQVGQLPLSTQERGVMHNQLFDLVNISEQKFGNEDITYNIMEMAGEIVRHNPSMLAEVATFVEIVADRSGDKPQIEVKELFGAVQECLPKSLTFVKKVNAAVRLNPDWNDLPVGNKEALLEYISG